MLLFLLRVTVRSHNVKDEGLHGRLTFLHKLCPLNPLFNRLLILQMPLTRKRLVQARSKVIISLRILPPHKQ